MYLQNLKLTHLIWPQIPTSRSNYYKSLVRSERLLLFKFISIKVENLVKNLLQDSAVFLIFTVWIYIFVLHGIDSRTEDFTIYTFSLVHYLFTFSLPRSNTQTKYNSFKDISPEVVFFSIVMCISHLFE